MTKQQKTTWIEVKPGIWQTRTDTMKNKYAIKDAEGRTVATSPTLAAARRYISEHGPLGVRFGVNDEAWNVERRCTCEAAAYGLHDPYCPHHDDHHRNRDGQRRIHPD